MVGQGGGGDGESFVRGGAAEGTLGAGDRFEEFEALRVGQSFKDGVPLGGREANWLRRPRGLRFLFNGRHLHFGVLDAMVMDRRGQAGLLATASSVWKCGALSSL